MKRIHGRKLLLNRETLLPLTADALGQVKGGGAAKPKQGDDLTTTNVCNAMPTIISCQVSWPPLCPVGGPQ